VRAQFQVHVLAVEYPGYGICPGNACNEQSVTENAFVAFRFVREVLSWPLDSILIMGRSIGCGPAISLAVRYQVSGIIIVCPMLSVKDLVKDVAGPLSYVVHEDRFPNKDRVPLIRSPLLVVHGQKDIMIPCRHGVELYGACRSRKLLVCPKDMEHNTNLLANVTYFVLPMLQFFSLPDYCFEDIKVPDWAYDKRLSPYYNTGSIPRSIVHLGSSEAKDHIETPNHPTMGCLTCPAMQSFGSPQEIDCDDSSTSTAFNRWLFGKKVPGSDVSKQPWAVAAVAAINGDTNGSKFAGDAHLQGPRTSAAIEKPGIKGPLVSQNGSSGKRGVPKVVPPPGAAEALPVPPPPKGAFFGPHPQPSPQAPLTPPPPLVSRLDPPVKSAPLAVHGHTLTDVQERTASRNRFQESAVLPTPPWRPSIAPTEPVQSEQSALPSDPSCSLKLLTPVDLVEIVEDLERHFACEGEEKVALEARSPSLSAPCSPAVKQWRSMPPAKTPHGGRRRMISDKSPIPHPFPTEPCKSPIETEWSV
jgi:hypothetical protein